MPSRRAWVGTGSSGVGWGGRSTSRNGGRHEVRNNEVPRRDRREGRGRYGSDEGQAHHQRPGARRGQCQVGEGEEEEAGETGSGDRGTGNDSDSGAGGCGVRGVAQEDGTVTRTTEPAKPRTALTSCPGFSLSAAG